MNELLEWVLGLRRDRCFLLGVNGPQGSGKSTLTAYFCAELARRGLRAATVSVDDFYLTRAEQVALARAHPANPYWQQRGYPGTHDVALGARVLRELRSPAAGTVLVPRYDKSAHQGKGDRAGSLPVAVPLDFLFLEGWMLGFTPVGGLADPALREVDEALPAYAAWHALLDGFLQLVPHDYHYALDWRVEAEARMRAAGKDGMSDAEARAYVELFLPAYATYLPRLAAHPPVAANVRRVEIGRNRLPRPPVTG